MVVISKSECSAHPSETARADVQQVAMYCKEKLICGESEFSFEELRAQKYNQRRKHEQWGTAVLYELFYVPRIILISKQLTFLNR